MITVTGSRAVTMHKQVAALLKRAKSITCLPGDHPLRQVYATNRNTYLNGIFGALKNTAVDRKVHISVVTVPPTVRKVMKALSDMVITQDTFGGPDLQFNESGCIVNYTEIECLRLFIEKHNNHIKSMDREHRIKHQLKLFGGIYDADDQVYYDTVMKPALDATRDAEAERRSGQSKKAKRIAKIDKPAKLKRIDDEDLSQRQLRKKYNGRWMRVRYDALVLLGTTCMCCGIPAKTKNEMGQLVYATGDHVMPFTTNPLLRTEPLNIQILCNFCNESKGHTDLTDWRTPAQIRKQMVARLGFAPDDDRDMMVLLEYIGYKHTQRESAKRLGIGQATVSRTYNKFKELLREEDRR